MGHRRPEAARLPGRAAILHSRLSAGEPLAEWQRVVKGDEPL